MAAFTDKVVLITGASSGVGAGTAVYFAGLGAKLALTGRNAERLQETVAKCVEAGATSKKICTATGDLTKEADLNAIFQKFRDYFDQFDVLVNCAGIARHPRGIFNTTREEYDSLFDINMRASFFLTQLVVPYLLRTKGCVVNVSAICGQRAIPELMPFCMTNAAKDSFTQCLAMELAAKGVRVNAICPASIRDGNIARQGTDGFTDEQYKQFMEIQNRMHPMGRPGCVKDMVQAIGFLASDQSSFITGQLLFVDGGRHAYTHNYGVAAEERPK